MHTRILIFSILIIGLSSCSKVVDCIDPPISLRLGSSALVRVFTNQQQLKRIKKVHKFIYGTSTKKIIHSTQQNILRLGSCPHEPTTIKTYQKKCINLFVALHQRKSYTALSKIYFWTATIHKWYLLLEPEENKELIISSLKKLSDDKLITVYAFVIMPNHIHLIWSQDAPNGKETPKGSLLKFTAHMFLRQLKATGKAHLYSVNASNKKHEIWQRDSLGIEIYSRETAEQKLNYIHFNPVSGKWLLAKDDLDYYYSSARFYETGIDEFGFLQNLYDRIDGV